jgi:hypothetical protein
MAILPNPGSLTIRVDAGIDQRWGADVPVEVRDPKTFALKARSVSGGTVDVPAGKYWVGAILPDGRQASSDDLVHITAGETKEVTVSCDDLNSPASVGQDSSPSGEPTVAASADMQILGAPPGARVYGNWLAARLELGPKPQRREPISSLAAETRLADLPAILEISTGREHPLYVAVPVDGENGRTTVHWKADPVSAEVKIRFDFHDKELNTFFEYVQQGLSQQARSISRTLIRQAESYLEEKRSVLCAVLAAYVLLRANEPEGLDRWSEQLCSRHEWLPDGVAIRIEYLAREGRHQEAAALLPILASRGAPWFRSGVAYAATRARLYVGAIATTKTKSKLEIAEQTHQLIDRMAKELDELTTALDLHQMISTYRDLPLLA